MWNKNVPSLEHTEKICIGDTVYAVTTSSGELVFIKGKILHILISKDVTEYVVMYTRKESKGVIHGSKCKIKPREIEAMFPSWRVSKSIDLLEEKIVKAVKFFIAKSKKNKWKHPPQST